MVDKPASFFVATEAKTITLGAILASQIKSGDLVLLEGDLGAGKSALARASIRALLAEPELEVPSPTFLLVLPYEGNGWSVEHADFYRIRQSNEIEELGIAETPGRVTFVEWPQRTPELYERADFVVSISVPPGNEGRQVVIRAPVDPSRLSALRKALTGDFEVSAVD